MIQKFDKNKLQCAVLPGKLNFDQEQQILIYNQTYKFWKSIYTEVYSQSQHMESLCPDNFIIQDQIFSLTYDQQVVGCILFSFHNSFSQVSQDIKYFEDVPEIDQENIFAQNHKKIMLMESLTVHPEWRKRITGLPISEYLLGLAIKYFVYSGCDLLVGTPRVDAKIHLILDKFGGQALSEISKSNYPCAVYVFDQNTVKESPLEVDSMRIQKLWNQCENQLNQSAKIAA